MASAVFGVTRYSIPMVIAFPAAILIFALLAYLLVWRNPERREIDSGNGEDLSFTGGVEYRRYNWRLCIRRAVAVDWLRGNTS
jgi:hypothetical protein